jgi:hypothetical protein
MEQRVDPVEILAHVSELDGRQRAFDVWIHKAKKAGWTVEVESAAPTEAPGTRCGTVTIEGLRYCVHHGKRIRRLVGYTPPSVHLISAAVAQSKGEEVPGTEWAWEFAHAAWAEPILSEA